MKTFSQTLIEMIKDPTAPESVNSFNEEFEQSPIMMKYRREMIECFFESLDLSASCSIEAEDLKVKMAAFIDMVGQTFLVIGMRMNSDDSLRELFELYHKE